ncbi:leishmanolysin family protein (macronuclear) [Tetrahymena thermophila SB210]|uniref:Leishmanolysin family protein n=1 Tax=Tetrahymena thermophila (strain SB210) TaxID=312017 RepID=I7M110_TETTS|nr:leishmanolysin family protein [Tetrahymena thermophila SB210]EAR93808.2 leishmanolysin family protein [Tetrahymena thermophila SB210]|eukprot:XP_001014053.2 leishmanolysin family protein [Tetrahymena thermophila SB210]
MKNQSKSTFIFLLVLFILSVHIRTHQEISCSHDQDETIQENYRLINEYFQKNPIKNSKDNQNRNLSSQKTQQIRITTDYTRLSQQPEGPAISQAEKDYLISLSNTAITFFSNFIKVQPNTKNSIFNPRQTNGTCLAVVPSENDKTIGIADSDLHLYFSYFSDSKSSELANAGFCNMQQTYTYIRPNFGRVQFNIANIKNVGNKFKSFQNNLKTVIHEMIHVLGFTFGAIELWSNREAYGLLGEEGANKILTTLNLRGIDTYLLGSSNVLDTAKKYYNCSELVGQQLENQGESGSKNYHWERTIIRNELMTASAMLDNTKLSVFTVALLKDTGYWDEVNENLSEPIYWGKDKGCDFFSNACQSTTQRYEEYPADNIQACSFDYDAQGYSTKEDTYGDDCNLIQSYRNRLCDNIDNQSPSIEVGQYNIDVLNDYSNNSKCFISNLKHPNPQYDYEENNLRCHQYQCSSDKTEIIITFSLLPGVQLVCGINDQGVQKDVVFSGFNLGQLTCPTNIMKLCDNQNCVNFCSSNGICVKGSCLCNSGYGGIDCNTKCNGFIDLGGSCVIKCPDNTFANPDNVCRPKCPNGYYAQKSGNLCKLCDFSCSQCIGPNSDQCLACQFLTYLDSNTCVQKCPIGKFADNHSKSCQSCPTGCIDCTSLSSCNVCSDGYEKSGETCIESLCTSPCKTCSSNPTFCLSCYSGLYLSPQNTCVSSCPEGYFKNSLNMTCTKCPIGCKNCSDAKNCTQCDKLNGYRQQGTDCTLCISPCATCSQENPNSCYSCENNMFIQNNQCVLACSKGFYLGKNNVCHQCLDGCESCSDSNSCISCNKDYQLFSDKNVQICINSTSCFSPCSTCSSTFQPTTCKTCESNYYLQGQKCVTQCDLGYFKMQSNSTCVQCPLNCKKCSSLNNCETCYDKYEIKQNDSTQICTQIQIKTSGQLLQLSIMVLLLTLFF